MGYILVDAAELDRQSIRHGEVLTDGRTIISMSKLRMMESTENIEFISSEAEVREKLMQMGYRMAADGIMVPPEVEGEKGQLIDRSANVEQNKGTKDGSTE